MRYKYDNYIAASPNRAYLATVLRTSAKILLRGTSDTLERLSEMPAVAFKKNN